jgi:succinyl-CoA synthetase beta subunit
MRLLEFQAKRLFQERGIPVPKGTLVRSSQDLEGLRYPVLLKAQVPVGGRGKAGAIRTVWSAQDAATALRELLKTSVKGCPIRAVLAEERIEASRELYFAVLIDRANRTPLLLASASGGIEIEEVARRDPTRVARIPVDLCLGPAEHSVRSLASRLELGDRLGEFRTIVERAFGIFRDLDATLVEINPLAVTAEGFLALDAKLLLDDKATFRHADLFRTLAEEGRALAPQEKGPAESLAEAAGLTYVGLDGDVGLISDGAGTGMLTLDLVQDAGGRAANFCELGALANAEGMREALGAVLANAAVKAVLVSLIGGLTRMDEIAEGIAAYLGEHAIHIPLVVRMAGTKEEEGRATLRAIGVETFDDLPAAVREAVLRAKEGRCRSS